MSPSESLLSGGSTTALPGLRGLVREATLRRLIRKLKSLFRPNPFHCWEMAVDATHTVFMVLRNLPDAIANEVDKLEVLALMLATLAHDVGHRGFTNAHLIKIGDTVALTYNDASPQVGSLSLSIYDSLTH